MVNNADSSNSDLQFPSEPSGDVDGNLQPIDERVDSAALQFPSFDDTPRPATEKPMVPKLAPSTSSPTPSAPNDHREPPAQPTSARHASDETTAMPTFTLANSGIATPEPPTLATHAMPPVQPEDDAASDDFNVPVWGAAEGSAAAADDEETELFPPAPALASINTHTYAAHTDDTSIDTSVDEARTATLPPIDPSDGTRVLGRTASSYTNTVIETGGAQPPAAFEPLEDVSDEDDGADTGGGEDRHSRNGGGNHKRRNIIIAVVAAIVVVALIVVGVVLWQRNTSANAKDAALTACGRSQQVVRSASALLDKEVKADTELASTPQDAVADGATLTALNDAMQQATSLQKDVQDIDAACAATLAPSALEQAAKRLDEQGMQIEDATKALKDTAAAVNASKTAKTQTDGIKKTLQSAIDDAQTLYDESAGLVQDEATREALLAAINDAKKTANDTNLTQEAADKAREALTTASDTVRASEDALTQANAAAEAQRQQELLQQQNAANGTQNGLDGTGAGTGVNGGVNGGATTPNDAGATGVQQ